MSDRPTIWREGDRIRATDGTGYSDRVSNEQIRQHIETDAEDRVFVAFALAVLAIRRYERAAEAGAS